MQEPAQRVFQYVDIAGGAEPAALVPAALPGIMGTFLGPTEATFAVLESSKLGADNIAVYACAPEFSADQLLGYTYAELATGDSVTGLWQGPPAMHLLQVRHWLLCLRVHAITSCLPQYLYHGSHCPVCLFWTHNVVARVVSAHLFFPFANLTVW